MAEELPWQELGSSVGVIDLDNIPDYTDKSDLILQLRLRTDNASLTSCLIRPDNDASAGSYSGHYLYGQNTTLTSAINAFSTATLFSNATWIPGTGISAGLYAFITMRIKSYNKLGVLRNAEWESSLTTTVLITAKGSCNWVNTTDVISRITITPSAGNYISTSAFRLWTQ
jgi:hypothetical protein